MTEEPVGVRERLRRARAAWASAGRTEQVLLDYPPPPGVRWGWGRPLNAPLRDRLAPSLDRTLGLLGSHLPVLGLDEVAPVAPVGSPEPSWTTGYISPLDGAVLSCVLAEYRPARFLEIGSGTSTRFARRTVDRLGLGTSICSVDPEPRADVDAICDEVLRTTLQDVDLGRFADLAAGDVAFFDGSHRALAHSDVATFFLDVVPVLAPGVVVHVHDVFLPADYPPEWRYRSYSEQYVLAALLLADPSVEVVAANHLLALERSAEVATIWSDHGVVLPEQPAYDTSFWFLAPGR